jgi:tetratricopeptide (TPR) repeat protein
VDPRPGLGAQGPALPGRLRRAGAERGALLAIGATGHHLPGFLRAYGDPVLFRRFRARFLAAPVFFLGISLAFAALGLRSLELVLVLWGAWHGAMQVNGFLRIYDAKVGSVSSAAARLDWAMCLTWFAGGLIYSEPKLNLLGVIVHQAGLPLPSPEALLALRQGWAVVAAAVTFAFLWNAVAAYRKGKDRGPNPLKFLAMGASFGFWWFCMVHVRIPLLGILLFEIFHDVQYNVLVWSFQRNRVAGGLSSSPLERLLFGPSPARKLAYLALILAYGVLGAAAGYGTLGLPGATGAPAIGLLSHLFIASAFLHFYYDGFIWKVREPDIRGGLGLAKAGERPVNPRPVAPAGRRLALQAALFGLPVLALGFAESRHAPEAPLEAYRRLAPLLPKTWEAQLAHGSLEMEAGNPREAALALQRAQALKPDLDVVGPRLLAQLFARGGDTVAAIAEYRRAVAENPEDMHSRYDLGLLLRGQGRLEEAVRELRAVADLHPENGGTSYSAGFALLLAGQVAEAIPYLERCVAADSLHKRGWNYLGVARESRGMLAEAIICYRRALAVDTAFAEARRNLSQAEVRAREAAPRAPAPMSRSPEQSRYQRAGVREFVLDPGHLGLHHDGIAFVLLPGPQVHPPREDGALRRPETQAVHDGAAAGGTDPLAQGGGHLALDLLPGGAGRQDQDGREGGEAMHSLHGIKVNIGSQRSERRSNPWNS